MTVLFNFKAEKKGLDSFTKDLAEDAFFNQTPLF